MGRLPDARIAPNSARPIPIAFLLTGQVSLKRKLHSSANLSGRFAHGGPCGVAMHWPSQGTRAASPIKSDQHIPRFLRTCWSLFQNEDRRLSWAVLRFVERVHIRAPSAACSRRAIRLPKTLAISVKQPTPALPAGKIGREKDAAFYSENAKLSLADKAPCTQVPRGPVSWEQAGCNEAARKLQRTWTGSTGFRCRRVR
jgi:hypothetical protein